MLVSYAINHALQRLGSCSVSLSVTASSKGNWVQCFQKKILKIRTKKPPHTSKRVTLRYVTPSHKNWWDFRDPGGLKDIESFLVWGKPEKHHQWLWNTEDANCVKRTKSLFEVCLSALMFHLKTTALPQKVPQIGGWRWDAVDEPLNKELHSILDSSPVDPLLFQVNPQRLQPPLPFPAPDSQGNSSYVSCTCYKKGLTWTTKAAGDKGQCRVLVKSHSDVVRVL